MKTPNPGVKAEGGGGKNDHSQTDAKNSDACWAAGMIITTECGDEMTVEEIFFTNKIAKNHLLNTCIL